MEFNLFFLNVNDIKFDCYICCFKLFSMVVGNFKFHLTSHEIQLLFNFLFICFIMLIPDISSGILDWLGPHNI